MSERLVSVKYLIENFRNSLLAVLPYVEAVNIPWREPENYDNWDRIAQAFFEGLVSEVIYETASEPIFPMAGYDVRIVDYNNNSVISLCDDPSWVFLCLETEKEPFDAVRLANILDVSLTKVISFNDFEASAKLKFKNRVGCIEVVRVSL